MGGSQAGWLRGIVKEVPTGDTVVVMAATKSGIPPEKRITLASIVAPRLVSAAHSSDRVDAELQLIDQHQLRLPHARCSRSIQSFGR